MSAARDPHAEGYDAWLAGKADLDNPYELGSDDAMSWNDGFAAAEEENSG